MPALIAYNAHRRPSPAPTRTRTRLGAGTFLCRVRVPPATEVDRLHARSDPAHLRDGEPRLLAAAASRHTQGAQRADPRARCRGECAGRAICRSRRRRSIRPAMSSGENVSTTGRYDETQQVLVRNRSYNGIPGYHVLDAAGAAERRRGDRQSRLRPAGDERRQAERSRSTVGRRHRGRPGTQLAQQARTVRPRDPAEGRSREVARADLVRLQQQMPYRILPRLRGARVVATPPTRPLLTPVPLPELDEGPHLSYAIQWFLFSALAVVGWVLVVRKTAKGSPRDRRDRRRPAA